MKLINLHQHGVFVNGELWVVLNNLKEAEERGARLMSIYKVVVVPVKVSYYQNHPNFK